MGRKTKKQIEAEEAAAEEAAAEEAAAEEVEAEEVEAEEVEAEEADPNETVIVFNKQARGLILPKAPSVPKEGLKGFGSVTLAPGRNEVSVAYLERVKESPTFVAWLQNGDLVFNYDKDLMPDSLGGYEVSGALAILKDVDDLPTIKRWKSRSARKTVSDALTARLKELS